MDYEDAFNIGSIQLEPRLQEYMRRRKFNEENDIEPAIPEEKEFCITPYDLKIIKRYNQGSKKLYTSRRLGQDPHFIKPDAFEFEDADVAFKQDPRYQRQLRKAQSHRDAQKKTRDFEGIDEDYTIFHQSNPYDLKPEKRSQRIAKPYDDPDNNLDDDFEGTFDDTVMMDSRDLVLGSSRPVRNSSRTNARNSTRDFDYDQYQKGNQKGNPDRGEYCYSPNRHSANSKSNTYHHTPKIDYRQRLTKDRMTVAGGMEHSRELTDIIGNLDSYNKHLNKTYDYVESEADLDTYTFTPGTRSATQRDTASSYQAIPFGYGNGLPDISVEESLKGGIRDSSKKSIGFKNPFENQFDYISQDVSDYRHTVQMWPQPTRGQNVEIARPDSASARHDKEMRDNIVGKYGRSKHESRERLYGGPLDLNSDQSKYRKSCDDSALKYYGGSLISALDQQDMQQKRKIQQDRSRTTDRSSRPANRH